MKFWHKPLLLSATMLLPLQAFAHNNESTLGFMAGLVHPFGGTDHLVTLLLAGWFIGYLANGNNNNINSKNIKRTIPAIGLLILTSLWIHGAWSHSAEIAIMDGHFILGFILASISITTASTLLSKVLSARLKNTAALNQ